MSYSLIIAPTPRLGSEIAQADNIQVFAFLNQPSLSPASKKSYERVLRNFFDFFKSCGINAVTTAHITLYLKKIEKSPSTKNFILKVISAFFNFTIESGFLVLNPAGPIRPEKVPDLFRFKILQREQIERMLELEENSQKKILLKILYFTGLRISEALSLKTSSFRDAENGGAFMTVIGKGTKVRTVFIPKYFYHEIKNYYEVQFISSGHLFFDAETLRPISRFQAFRIVQASAKRAKVDPIPSPHWFRHSSATHAIEAGAPIHVVQATLGHSSITITGRYLHAAQTESNASYLFKK
jgi:integrase/recombinase XerD